MDIEKLVAFEAPELEKNEGLPGYLAERQVFKKFPRLIESPEHTYKFGPSFVIYPDIG